MLRTSNIGVSLVLLACKVSAAIVDDGLWTGEDWYDDVSQIGVRNGVPYSDDPKVQRRLTSPSTFDGDVEQIYQVLSNVQRV